MLSAFVTGGQFTDSNERGKCSNPRFFFLREIEIDPQAKKVIVFAAWSPLSMHKAFCGNFYQETSSRQQNHFLEFTYRLTQWDGIIYCLLLSDILLSLNFVNFKVSKIAQGVPAVEKHWSYWGSPLHGDTLGLFAKAYSSKEILKSPDNITNVIFVIWQLWDHVPQLTSTSPLS